MSFLLAMILSTNTFAADWQCGKFIDGPTPRLALDSDNYYKYALLPANEETDDFVAKFTGARLCVKGKAVAGTRAALLIYSAKEE